MADQNFYGFVQQDALATTGEGSFAPVKLSKRGDAVIIDWYTQMAIEGRVYEVKAGTITTPIVGDVLITDAAAEMCVDAPTSATTIIPCYANISLRLGTGTLHEYAIKSVGAVSTAGTAFVPLNNLIGEAASVATALAQTAGAVTVSAELATTTRRHWSASNPVAVGAGNTQTEFNWKPKAPPVITGAGCFYVQIAAATTGPTYYASFDFVELLTTAIS